MANEKTPVVWDDDAKKHRPLGSGEKMGGLSASSMISSDSGNLLQQGSDGLMLVTGSSLADPRADNLLEESDNGKLQVTSDRVVEWLEGHPQAAAAIAEAVKVVSEDSGNVVVQGSDKGAFMSKEVLTSAVSEMTPAQMSALADALRKAGGGLNVDPSTGKLVVDFGSMDPNIMRSVVLSMVQQGGGIAVDQSGKLYVDFDNMPTAKFEALLKSLKMQIPLSGDLNLYVDKSSPAAADTLDEGRGTQAKPFRSIQACISYATQNYAIGPYALRIYVSGDVYTESVYLSTFTRTSGRCELRAMDMSRPPTIANPGGGRGCVDCFGGPWYLICVNASSTFYSPGDGINHYPSVVTVRDGGDLHIAGCGLSGRYDGVAHSRPFYFYIVSCFGSSTIGLYPIAGHANSFMSVVGNSTGSDVFYLERNAQITMAGANFDDDNIAYTYQCSGSATNFMHVTNNSLFTRIGGVAHEPQFAGTMTCRPYNVITGSGVLAPANGFPGDGDPVLDSSTYSWYKV